MPTKKSSAKESTGDKPQTNGTEPIENGVNGTEDVDMADDGPGKGSTNEGEDEMTVVVPPPKGSKLTGDRGKDDKGDVAMENSETVESLGSEAKVDPKVKAVAGKLYSMRMFMSFVVFMKRIPANLMEKTLKATFPSWNVL